MDYAAFMARYGTSERRRQLIALLKVEVEAAVAEGGMCRAFIVGSVVTQEAKSEPGDIDVLLGLSRPSGAKRWRQITPYEDVQTFKLERRPVVGSGSELQPCPNAVELLARFHAQEEIMGSEVRVNLADLVEFEL